MVTGVGELAVSEITREPVTTTLSTPEPDCASAAEPHSAETAAPHARMFLHFMVFPFPVEFFCSMSENALCASGYKNRRAALTGQCRPSTARSMTVGLNRECRVWQHSLHAVRLFPERFGPFFEGLVTHSFYRAS
jgi:hypothetical protein